MKADGRIIGNWNSFQKIDYKQIMAKKLLVIPMYQSTKLYQVVALKRAENMSGPEELQETFSKKIDISTEGLLVRHFPCS